MPPKRKEARVEGWRRIPGAATAEVSNLGRVREAIDGAESAVQPTYGTGYPVVSVKSEAGTRKLWPVHRAVLFAFVGAPEKGMVTRHLNGKKHDNDLKNLTWGTSQENAMDRARHKKEEEKSRPPRDPRVSVGLPKEIHQALSRYAKGVPLPETVRSIVRAELIRSGFLK